MFYSRDGKIVTREGKALERKVKTLTFEVEGRHFPKSYYNYANDTNVLTSGRIEILSSTPNSILVNYGDGTSVVKYFSAENDYYVIRYNIANETPPEVIPQHEFTDNYSGRRSITFEFLLPENITSFNSDFVQLHGALPSELFLFKNLIDINISYASLITSVSIDFPKKIESFSLRYSTKNKLTKLEDSLFQTKLDYLAIDNGFDLSDPIASNFFKINQLSNTLISFSASNCNMSTLPKSLGNCTNISDLKIEFNSIVNPEVVGNNLFNLTRLYIGLNENLETLFETSNLLKLAALALSTKLNNFQINDIPIKWVGLKSLSSFVLYQFMIKTNAKFDLFIDNFYTLCTTNGFLDPASQTAIDTGYPNQFRNISWGHSALTQTGAIQAPAEFVQGVSNGDLPMTQGEKIYVLKENYGHIITTAQP